MIQLVYMSAALCRPSRSELVALLAKARQNNSQLGVTGMLLYHDGSFMQVLEGDEQAVADLYNKIALDPRHAQAQVIYQGDIATRSFPNWSMGFCDGCDEAAEQVDGYQDFFGPSFSRHVFAANPTLARKLLVGFRVGRWRQRLDIDDEVLVRQ